MKDLLKIAVTPVSAALFAALLFAQGQSSQDEKAKQAKAQNIARAFELNARTITLLNRQGKELRKVGERGMYGAAVLSPDATRLAVLKSDLEKENQDIFVIDLATGSSTQITSGQSREFSIGPVWSPDGSQIAYVALRGGSFEICRKPSNGQGTEEVLLKLPGIAVTTDWSSDGRFLTISSSDLGGSVISALPVTGSSEHKLIEVFRSPKQVQAWRLSPDGRLLAYVSNETGKNEMYVRRFDPGAPASDPAGPWKISDQGALGGGFWRGDGKEFYYLAADRAIMAVPVSAAPSVAFGKPNVIYRIPDSIGGGAGDISRNGELMVMTVPPPQLRQLTVLDRQGKVVKTVGQPGLYLQPHLSPDASKIVVMRTDPETSNQDIWTYEVESGAGHAVTHDNWPHNAPLWSPDGKTVLYVSTRDSYSSIYRKAWDGSGEEEVLFRYTPGAGMVLTDASPDGKFATFHTGVMVLVPLRPDQKPLDRKAIDWLREDYDVVGGRFSPDEHLVAYLSNETNVNSLEVYVRPFDATKPDEPPRGKPIQISTNGAMGMVNWR
ncbi:MAG: PD40 domain-containing protein, partial [Acidobacteriia bacterium]|nr:PD40 domain-containing protein [Terriglobia bacterium]